MNRHPYISIVLTLFFCVPLCSAQWKSGDTVPNLNSFGLEGSVPSLKGKVVYLDFWASWCVPCKVSFPILSKWQKQYGSADFVVLGVSVDEKASDMQAFLKRTQAAFATVRDSQHKLVAVAQGATMPTGFLIDRKGKIREVHNGFRAKDEQPLQKQIEALLAEK